MLLLVYYDVGALDRAESGSGLADKLGVYFVSLHFDCATMIIG